ncbi:MAG: 4'-phosphopantetheinyl transferase superfamily protein [Bacteroidia bacterium]
MPLQFIRNLDNGSRLGLWKLTETPEELLQYLQFNDQEKALFLTLNGASRRMQWLGSRVLLRQLLQTDHFIEMTTDENGKPALVNFPFEVSLSHSFCYAAAIIGKSRVGIDIEMVKDKIRKIAPRFVTPQEQDFLKPATEVEQLYAIWCAKESLFKLYGQGQLNFRSHIRVHPFDITAETLKATIHKNNFIRNYEVHFERIDGYMLAYTAEE